MTAWYSVKNGLEYRTPMTEEEKGRQPIVWNPLFMSRAGCILGSRTGLQWGPLAAGPARTLNDWEVFCSKPQSERENVLLQYRGDLTMFLTIQETLQSTDLNQCHFHANRWFAFFFHE